MIYLPKAPFAKSNPIISNQENSKAAPNKKKKEPNEILRMAVLNGDLNLVRYITTTVPRNHQADLHANDEAALRVASMKGYLSIVKFLVEHGANPHIWEDTPLRYAVMGGYVDIIKFFIEKTCSTGSGS